MGRSLLCVRFFRSVVARQCCSVERNAANAVFKPKPWRSKPQEPNGYGQAGSTDAIAGLLIVTLNSLDSGVIATSAAIDCWIPCNAVKSPCRNAEYSARNSHNSQLPPFWYQPPGSGIPSTAPVVGLLVKVKNWLAGTDVPSC